MSSYWRCILRILILFWAGYMALAQPGLPQCWFEARACEFHPHFSQQHAGSAHTHDFLFDLATATAPLGLPVLLVPVSLLIEFLFLSLLLGSAVSPAIIERVWIAPPEPPPPRLSFSS